MEMKRMAKEAGYINARIEVKEKIWNGKEDGNEGKRDWKEAKE